MNIGDEIAFIDCAATVYDCSMTHLPFFPSWILNSVSRCLSLLLAPADMKRGLGPWNISVRVVCAEEEG